MHYKRAANYSNGYDLKLKYRFAIENNKAVTPQARKINYVNLFCKIMECYMCKTEIKL